MSFLSSVAKYYIDRKPTNNWNDLRFVFPSHRAGVFFKNALQKQLGDRVVVGVGIYTIGDFFSLQSKLKVTDNLTLTFELYKIYHELFHDVLTNVDDFDFFYSWASTFLSDFDDIDKYMADAHQIFTNVYEYNDLSDDYSHLSDEQREAIMRFWNVAIPKDRKSVV